MTKESRYNGAEKAELEKAIADKREALRALRFNVAGSKNKNVKAARSLRKEIARVLTARNMQ